MKKQEQIKAFLTSKQEQDELDSFRRKNDKIKKMQELVTKHDNLNTKENSNKDYKSNKVLSLYTKNLTRGSSKKTLQQNNLHYESCRQELPKQKQDQQHPISPFSHQSMKQGKANFFQKEKLKYLISPVQSNTKKSSHNLTSNSIICGQDKSFSKLMSVSSNDLVKQEVQQKYQAMKNLATNQNKEKRVSLKEATSVVNRLYQQDQKRQQDLSQLQTTKIVQELSQVRKTPVINKYSKTLTKDSKNQLLDVTQSFLEKKKENLSFIRLNGKKALSDIRKVNQNQKNKSITEELRLNPQIDLALSASRIEQFTQSQYKWLQKKNEDLSRIRLELEEKQSEISYSYKPKLCQKSLQIIQQKAQMKSLNQFDIESQTSFYEQLQYDMQKGERNYNFFDDMEDNKYHYLRL